MCPTVSGAVFHQVVGNFRSIVTHVLAVQWARAVSTVSQLRRVHRVRVGFGVGNVVRGVLRQGQFTRHLEVKCGRHEPVQIARVDGGVFASVR